MRTIRAMPPSSMTLPIAWPLPPEVPPALRAWRVPLLLDEPIPADDWAVLSPAEADRAARLRQPADRVRSACTRAAL
ncbi:4-phosphopantetheinyl transferase, partial [Paracidovorax avenae]